MKNISFGIIIFFTFCSVIKAATLESSFSITNRIIEKEVIISSEPNMRYTDNGNGFYTITDGHTDANIDNLNISPQKSAWWGYGRSSSLVSITMKGQRLGHTFKVLGKLGESSVRLLGNIPTNPDGTGASILAPRVGTCDAVNDEDSNYKNRKYIITVSSDMNKDARNCFTRILKYTSSNQKISSVGLSRIFYLDLASLQKNIDYRNAPSDVYTGSATTEGAFIAGGNPSQYKRIVPYTNNVTIYKKPYFDNVTLFSSDNIFTIKTIGNKFTGNVSVPLILNGQFTPYDKVTLKVTSNNNFNLKNGTESIPYSLSTTLGTRKFQIANNGISIGVVTFTDLPKSTSSMQGRFDADFSVNTTSISAGDYSDTLTAVYEIDLY